MIDVHSEAGLRSNDLRKLFKIFEDLGFEVYSATDM